MNIKTWVKVLIGLVYLRIKYPNICFKLINDQLELKKMYDLVWEVYAQEKKYINSHLFSQEILKDEFEKNAIKIGAFLNKKELIGTLRIIFNSSRGFFVENDFNVDLSLFSKNEIAEISRLVIKQSYRNNFVSLGLLKKAFDLCKKRKIKYWIVVIPKELKDHYEISLGIKFQLLKMDNLTEKHLKIREKMKYYYLTTNPKPYLIDLTTI